MHHPRRRRRSLPGITAEGTAFNQPDTQWMYLRLLTYAQRLLDSYNRTEVLLGFVLDLLEGEQRRIVVSTIEPEASKGDDDARLFRLLHDPERLCIELWDIMERRHAHSSTAQVWIQLLHCIANQFPQNESGNGFHDYSILLDAHTYSVELASIKDLFDLTPDEVEIVVICYLSGQCGSFENLCETEVKLNHLKLIAICAGIDVPEIASLLDRRGTLIGNGIIAYYEDCPGWQYVLTDPIVDYISGHLPEGLASRFAKRNRDPVFDIHSFGVPDRSLRILEALLSSDHPANVLLYGAPGTGKTEFAKTLGRICGKKTWFFEFDGDPEPWELLVALQVAARTVSVRDSVLVIDEADWLLNTGLSLFGSRKRPEKGMINLFLDSCPAHVVWITNNVQWMADSIRRRFSYSIKFKHLNRHQKAALWSGILENHPLRGHISHEAINRLTEFNTNAGNISDALNIASLLPTENITPFDLEQYLFDIMKRQERLQTGRETKIKAVSFKCYDPSVLNTDVDVQSLLATLKNYLEMNIRSESGIQFGCKLLFWGDPGTGKTAFARHIARELGREIVLKRASDLLSMWVGETEKNIRDVFEEAENEGSVLLIDEADSFFRKREYASAYWVVTQTNELLTQIESFSGILICCTNLLDSLDGAVLRRFNWKVEFKPLTGKAALRLVKRYFPDVRFSSHDSEDIAALGDLTPGDIYTVWEGMKMRSDGKPRSEDVVQALASEIRYRNKSKERTIGF